MAVDINQFARTLAFDLPQSMMVQGLPRVWPIELIPMIHRTATRVGFANRQRLCDRLERHYSKMAIGPRLQKAPRKFV